MALTLIRNENFRNNYYYQAWLSYCYIVNGKASLAWELHLRTITSSVSFRYFFLDFLKQPWDLMQIISKIEFYKIFYWFKEPICCACFCMNAVYCCLLLMNATKRDNIYMLPRRLIYLDKWTSPLNIGKVSEEHWLEFSKRLPLAKSPKRVSWIFWHLFKLQTNLRCSSRKELFCKYKLHHALDYVIIMHMGIQGYQSFSLQ